jgi:hypothetical protein
VPLAMTGARAIGMMMMTDAGVPDHKIVAVATGDPGVPITFSGCGFFRDYQQRERKVVDGEEICPAKAALRRKTC